MTAPAPRWPEPLLPLARISIPLIHVGPDPAAHDLSAVAVDGSTLFLGADEAAHVELAHRGTHGFGDPSSISLGSVFDLPDDADELDIEGLAVDAGRLWIVGSHSVTRRKLKPGAEATPDSLARLAKIKECPNRAFLGSIDLVALEVGRRALGRDAQMLAIKNGEDALKRRLADDPILAPFLAIPAKENGLDIEGIAVAGERVTVGLRGPVVGGWACLLDLPLRSGGGHGLKLDGAPVKHWIDLDGLGVRDLKRDGDDLLILAGPSMAVSGPAAVYRWHSWTSAPSEPSVQRPELVLPLPYGRRCDHPEALVPLEHEGARALLVLNDSPHPSRLVDGAVMADLFALHG